MRWRVRFELLVASDIDAGIVETNVALLLASRPTYSVDMPLRRQTWHGQVRVQADIRFQIQADANQVYDGIRARWATGNLVSRIQAGSVVILHACPHEEGEAGWGNCAAHQLVMAVRT